MKGWHNEPQRHSLAARGISTRARALVRPSGDLDPRQIDQMYRIFRDIDELARILNKGGLTRQTSGIYGGITTAPLFDDEMGWVSLLGDCEIVLDPDVILRENDLIKVEYTDEFLRRNPDILDWIMLHQFEGKTTESFMKRKLRIAKEMLKHEQEIVSREPIIIPIEAVKRINIRYGFDIRNPLTGGHEWEMTEEDSWKLGRRVIENLRRKIPDWYWDRIWLINTTTGEEQMLRWLI